MRFLAQLQSFQHITEASEGDLWISHWGQTEVRLEYKKHAAWNLKEGLKWVNFEFSLRLNRLLLLYKLLHFFRNSQSSCDFAPGQTLISYQDFISVFWYFPAAPSNGVLGKPPAQTGELQLWWSLFALQHVSCDTCRPPRGHALMRPEVSKHCYVEKKIPHRLHPGIKTVKRTGANTCNTSEICFSQIQWTEGEGEVSLTSIQSVKTESVALGSGSFKTEVKLHCADKWLETMQLSFILLIKPTGCVLITLQVVILSVTTEPTEHWWFLDIWVKKKVKSYLKAAKNNWDTLPGRFIRYSLLVLVFRSELR